MHPNLRKPTNPRSQPPGPTWRALGFLPQYLNVEGYDQGSRFLLLAGLGLRPGVAKPVAVVLLAGVTVAVLCTSPRRVPVERAALWLVGAAFLIATPAQPWYGVLLAVLAVLAARPEWLAVPAAAYVLYISLFTRMPVDAWTLRRTAGTSAEDDRGPFARLLGTP